MAKSKYAPALFEVISGKDEKSANKLAVPKWWQSKNIASAPAKPVEPAVTATPVRTEANADSAKAAAGPVEPALTTGTRYSDPAPAATAVASPPARPTTRPSFVRETPAPPPGTATEASPLAQMQGGRIRLALKPWQAAVAAGTILLVMLVAFELGKSGRSDVGPTAAGDKSKDDIAALAQSPAKPETLNVKPPTAGGSPSKGGTASPAQPKARTPEAPKAGNTTTTTPPAGAGSPQGTPVPPVNAERIPGKCYLIFETFKPTDQDEAEQARQWFAQQGVEATIEPIGQGQWQLVGTVAFDSDTDKVAKEFRTRVIEMGTQYKKELGTRANYNMRSPAFCTARLAGENRATKSGQKSGKK